MLRREDDEPDERGEERSRGDGGKRRPNRAAGSCWVAFQIICRTCYCVKVVVGENKNC